MPIACTRCRCGELHPVGSSCPHGDAIDVTIGTPVEVTVRPTPPLEPSIAMMVSRTERAHMYAMAVRSYALAVVRHHIHR